MFVSRLKEIGMHILGAAIVVLMGLALAAIAGTLAVGPLFWIVCAIGGLFAGILSFAPRFGWRAAAVIVLCLIIAKISSLFAYRELGLRPLDEIDAIAGTLCFITAYVIAARHIKTRPNLRA